MKDGIEERLNHSLQTVKLAAIKMLHTEKVFPNVVFVIGMDFAEPIPFMFENRAQKKFMVTVIRGYVKARNAIGVIMASDAWTATQKQDGKAVDVNSITPPSESPDRKQALIITATGENFSKGFMIPYERKDGKSVMEKEEPLDGHEDFNFGDLFRSKLDS